MNTTIYNALGNSITNNIASTRFYYKVTGNGNNFNSYNVGQVYNYERNGASTYNNSYINANIALINWSDYGYSTLASSCSRTQTSFISDQNCSQNSWIGKMMYKSIGTNSTWTVQQYPANSGTNTYLDEPVYFSGNSSWQSIGNVNWNCPNAGYYVFPVFYLKGQGYISKGVGTSSNPYYFSL